MNRLIHRIQARQGYMKVMLFSFLFIFVAMPVFASTDGLGSWRSKLDTGARASGVNTEVDSPDQVIETVINTLLSFLGVIFLILMIYGGFLWMTARGNEEQVTKSKNLIIAAVIGLIIVLASYAISFFVIDALTEETLDF